MSVPDLYLAPAVLPVSQLSAKTAFEGLTAEEKLYAFHLSKGAWDASVINLHQVSTESVGIFRLIRAIFFPKRDEVRGVDDLVRLCAGAGGGREDVDAVLQYSAAFLGNMGNYLSFGDTKFIPRCPAERFRAVAEGAGALAEFQAVAQAVYGLEGGARELGFPPHGVSAYYGGEDVGKDVVDRVDRVLAKHKLSPLNTRVFRRADGTLEVRVASAEAGAQRLHGAVLEGDDGLRVAVSYGDFAPYLAKLAGACDRARAHAANDHQRSMLAEYAKHFRSGDVLEHDESQRHWVQDKGPVVETNLGFIETYRDPAGVRAEYEGLVAVVNKTLSARFNALVEAAEPVLALLPWGPAFEKDRFLRPDFTSLDVIAFANCGVPAGINIPNNDDIRQNFGFKNVSLGNVLSSRLPDDRTTFLLDADQAVYARRLQEAFEVQVALHELLGHGSGKLFYKGNYDPALVDPFTGKPVTCYPEGATWDATFGPIASSYEECKAECVGVFLCPTRSVLAIFGHTDDAECEEVIYVNVLNMVRAGLVALETYNPQTKAWGQAHMRARHAILRVLLEDAGEGVVRIEKVGDKDLAVVLDRSRVVSHAVPAVGRFLHKLQVYKSTANLKDGAELYNRLTAVPDEWLERRDIVMAQRKPRKVFVQPVLELGPGGAVEYHEFPASAEGIIQSFARRGLDIVL